MLCRKGSSIHLCRIISHKCFESLREVFDQICCLCLKSFQGIIDISSQFLVVEFEYFQAEPMIIGTTNPSSDFKGGFVFSTKTNHDWGGENIFHVMIYLEGKQKHSISIFSPHPLFHESTSKAKTSTL
jgi:hypothetical protein